MMLLWASHFACKEQQRVWWHCKPDFKSDASLLLGIKLYTMLSSEKWCYGEKFHLANPKLLPKVLAPGRIHSCTTITEATTGSRLEVTAPVSVYASASAASSPIPKQKTSDIPPHTQKKVTFDQKEFVRILKCFLSLWTKISNDLAFSVFQLPWNLLFYFITLEKNSGWHTSFSLKAWISATNYWLIESLLVGP